MSLFLGSYILLKGNPWKSKSKKGLWLQQLGSAERANGWLAEAAPRAMPPEEVWGQEAGDLEVPGFVFCEFS